MPGTLTISTLSDGTNSTSATNAIQGSAKAWVNFNGTTSPGTIRASYNVSSVTKNSTGNFTLNFTNALADANYAAAGIATDGSGGSASADAKQLEYRAATTTTFNFVYARQYSTYTLADCTVGCIAIFR